MSLSVSAGKMYQNDGNQEILASLETGENVILDVGCGCGNNADIISRRFPGARIYGVTLSSSEAKIASRHMRRCFVFDIEREIDPGLAKMKFDVLIFSHVLEHTRKPAEVIDRFLPLLRTGGRLIAAVPNVLFYRQRWDFLRGRFEYQSSGTMDDTHMRFFTYYTAQKYLVPDNSRLSLLSKTATGSLPAGTLRKFILPKSWSKGLDDLAGRLLPNFFGHQILLKWEKKGKRTGEK